MKIFVYEWVTGGGMLATGERFPDTLLQEGSAMLHALVADFSRISDCEVSLLYDHRLVDRQPPCSLVHTVTSVQEERQGFDQLACGADWTVVIAPESDGRLLSCVSAVRQAGGRLLGPTAEMVALATNKHDTAEHLRSHGVPVPPGRLIPPGRPLPEDWTYPAILKPVDGAGSVDVVLQPDPQSRCMTDSKPRRLERFVPGVPVSVSLLCGPRKNLLLPACRQRIDQPSGFRWLGGYVPLAALPACRAHRLAMRTMRTLSQPLGYLGIDLVLGDDPCGSQDVVLEINPRLTTSYVGLRALAQGNIAQAMVDLARGLEVHLPFRSDFVEFTSRGVVSELAHHLGQPNQGEDGVGS